MDDLSVESLILVNLLYNEDYARSIVPYVKSEYFEDKGTRVVFEEYEAFIRNYNSIPTKEALYLELETRSDLGDQEFKDISEKLDYYEGFSERPLPDQTWLKDTTEQYCKDRAVFLAIGESIEILEGEHKKKDKNAIPELLSDALAVTFDEYIGHDFLAQAEDRWDFYHKVEEKMKFDLEWFNEITGGGLPKKTLSVILAPTNSGKTLCKCHMAANFMMNGRNVLYITMEMAEERISERIDANLLDIDIGDLAGLPKDIYAKRIQDLRKKTPGKLFVKEFPTAGAHVGHFRHLIRELEMKKKFTPDIVFVDYLNICASSRVKNGENTYVLVKSIAEELRGLAVEKNIAIISSTQTNRDGWGSSDLELSNTSESAGLPATADFMVGLIVTDELNKMGQIMFKQLKNRFTDVTRNVRTTLGVDRPKMRLYDVEQPLDENVNQGSVTTQNLNSKPKSENPFEGFVV